MFIIYFLLDFRTFKTELIKKTGIFGLNSNFLKKLNIHK
jgi:hypothetical protein